MSEGRLKEKFFDYSKAVSRLTDVVEVEKTNDYIYDAVIQRFEFTYELAWKLLKAYMSYNGIADVNSPREAFKEAFASGLIHDGNEWISMLKDRNLTTHTYDESQAIIIYENIKKCYIHLFIGLREKLMGEIRTCGLE